MSRWQAEFDALLSTEPRVEAVAPPRPALVVVPKIPDVPRVWLDGAALIAASVAPERIPAARWQCFREDCTRFMASPFSVQAARLGWSELDVFGVDRARPCERPDGWGLVWLLHGAELSAICENIAAVRTPAGNLLSIRRRQLCAGAIPAWELLNTVPMP